MMRSSANLRQAVWGPHQHEWSDDARVKTQLRLRPGLACTSCKIGRNGLHDEQVAAPLQACACADVCAFCALSVVCTKPVS